MRTLFWKGLLSLVREGVRMFPGRKVYVELSERGVRCTVGKLRSAGVADLGCLAREGGIKNGVVFGVRTNERWRWGFWNVPIEYRQRVRNVLAIYLS